jgi:hypothetical protein
LTGSVGETVTYQSRFGIIRRQKVIPRDPRTPLQLDRRTAFQRARSFWGTLTDEQFLAWNTLARTRRTHPVLGQSSGLSGYVCDITGLSLAKFHLLPVGKRIFIRTVQQINGWHDLPQTISARIPAQ